MPRIARIAPAGVVFHVINRGVARREIFLKDEDYAAFERAMAHALIAVPIQLFCYCLMPNHWHLLLRPREDGQLGKFMALLTMTHVRRWQEHYDCVGQGHLYQGRFRSFPVQKDDHFLTVARYIERNALRAKRVDSAQDWKWSSLWRRLRDEPGREGPDRHGETDRVKLPLAAWPVEPPDDWVKWIQLPQTTKELDSLRLSVDKGRPFGDPKWQAASTRRLKLHSSYREPGRPLKKKNNRTRPV